MENILRIFLRSLRIGRVTRRYPDVPDPAPPWFRGKPVVDASRCLGDQACVEVCPSGAISTVAEPGGYRWQLDYARCVFCGLCAEGCAQGAIVMTPDYELASRTRADLQVVIHHKKDAVPQDRGNEVVQAGVSAAGSEAAHGRV